MPPRLYAQVRTAAVALALFVGPLVRGAAAVSVPTDYPTIQAAINAVSNGSLPDGTTIDVQPGTYYETLAVGATSRSFTVRGVNGASATVVDAVGKGAAVINVYGATGHIIFKGLTFRHGAPPSAAGGGFVIQNSAPSFTDCIFELNSASNGGGGVLITSNATFTRCIVRNNSAAHFGGGVFIVAGSRPVFTSCDIVNNASGTGGPGVGNTGAGGGVNSNDSSPTFLYSRIDGNTSKFAAGGIFHLGIFGSAYGVATLVLTDTEVTDNVSTRYSSADNPAEGGGIHIEDNVTVTLTRVRVLRNQAETGGGLNAYRAQYDVVDSVIDSNSATTGFGGGISASSNNPTPPVQRASIVNLTKTLVRNNTAFMGGGIAVVGDNYGTNKATLSLASSVVDSNHSSDQGGGILANRAIVTVNASLIIRNSVSGGTTQPAGGGILITTGSAATVSGSTIANNAATQNGGGIYLNDNSSLQVTGSNIYSNTTSESSFGSGGLFVGPAGTSGAVQSSVIADNSGYQIKEQSCPSATLTYQNNTITPASGSQFYVGGDAVHCAFTAVTSINQFNTLTNVSGNKTGTPSFAQFLAVPSAGAATTLVWSVARATSVTIAGVGSFSNMSTGTVDVVVTQSTSYSLTATAASGSVGPLSTSVVFVRPFAPTGHTVDGDFDGDGKADVSVFRPSTGAWYIRASGPTSIPAVTWGGSGDMPVPGDYDGDGKVDIAVFRPSTGTWYIRYSATTSSAAIVWGGSVDTPVPGDYDGDGITDIAVFRASTGTWYIRYSATPSSAAVVWGGSGDIAVPADYDGDGVTDIAVFRPSTGTWYIRYSATPTTGTIVWGASIDIPVAGDYDGDGKADIGVFRVSTGTWYLRYSGSPTSLTIVWGGGTDIPVPGDYDGDGKVDVAVFRPSTGTWYIRYSGTPTSASIVWGGGSDIPILKQP